LLITTVDLKALVIIIIIINDDECDEAYDEATR